MKNLQQVVCGSCGKRYDESDYEKLSRAIMKLKIPACSYECNVKLGQVKPRAEEKQ
jgi:NAD-dependent SIR2 family protein deacetylase